jgi:hypothetical protein
MFNKNNIDGYGRGWLVLGTLGEGLPRLTSRFTPRNLWSSDARCIFVAQRPILPASNTYLREGAWGNNAIVSPMGSGAKPRKKKINCDSIAV